MNCSHCKAQWTPPPNKSVSTCPFCGKPLVDPADVSVDTKPEVILRQVVERFDMTILGERRLSAILKDLMPHVERKYLRIFTQAINDGIGEKLLKLTKETAEVRNATLFTLKESFRQHNGYDHTADYVVDCFLYALGWNDLANSIKTSLWETKKFKCDKNDAEKYGLIVGETYELWVAQKDGYTQRGTPVNTGDWFVVHHPQESQIIKQVTIGQQIWMAENLNVDQFRNGDPIPEAKTNEEWIAAGEQGKPAWCYYKNEPENGKKYGKLYNWFAVNDIRRLAPEGWHVPSYEEWNELSNYLGGEKLAGSKLKTQNGWCWGKGFDIHGFSALPGGFRLVGGPFSDIEFLGFWWSSTDSLVGYARYWLISADNSNLSCSFNHKQTGLSVRCVKHVHPIVNIIEEKKTHTEVTIGNQVWIKENLNVAYFRNGDPIPEAKTDKEWLAAGEQGKPAWCYYENDPENGKKYGKLYNWYAVNDARGLAPEGWHVPTDAEWSVLISLLSGEDDVGTKLKSQFDWLEDGNGIDKYGFSALPGGWRYYNGVFCRGTFVSKHTGSWWSASENDTISAFFRSLYIGKSDVSSNSSYKSNGFSVRCIKD